MKLPSLFGCPYDKYVLFESPMNSESGYFHYVCNAHVCLYNILRNTKNSTNMYISSEILLRDKWQRGSWNFIYNKTLFKY